jgi:hypothetical protein
MLLTCSELFFAQRGRPAEKYTRQNRAAINDV